jgi:hypothetical protein
MSFRKKAPFTGISIKMKSFQEGKAEERVAKVHKGKYPKIYRSDIRGK